MRRPKLLACPFCGSKARVVTERPCLPGGRRDRLYVIECSLRECGARTAKWYPLKAAVAAWNRRTDDAKIAVLEADLQACWDKAAGASL